jgi:hypothetical protein
MNSTSSGVLKKRRIVGVIAIALLLLFTVLALIGVFNWLEWVIADLAVALMANLILRRIGR